MATLARFEPYPHTGNVALDDVDDFLVSPYVGVDETKVISIWEGDMMCGFIICVKLVAMIFLHIFQVL